MNRSELTVRIFREVAIVQERTDFFLKRDLPTELPSVQYKLLNHLIFTTNVDETPSDLARNSHVTLSAMSQVIKQLKTKGYLELDAQTDDARRKVVRITQAGRQAHEAASEAIRADLRPLATKLPLQDLEQLHILLHRFRVTFEAVTSTAVATDKAQT